MWHYCWAHSVYHLIRWFPHNNRLKARIVVLIFTFMFLIPQIVVLSQQSTGRYCATHLLEMLIVSIVFTFCMIGFSFLFSLMEPTPWEVKIGFHVFGGLTFVIGLTLTVLTAKGTSCAISTTALYYYSVGESVFAMMCIVFFLVVIPFWIINRVCKNRVLDRRYRDGVCYEPVKCCSCVWHV